MVEIDDKSAICLLIEKHYHFGAAALLNSLIHCGYAGSVWIAYRDELPPWTQGRLEDCPQGKLMSLKDRLLVYFHRIETDSHFKYKKAEFLLWCIENSPVELKRIFYTDADLVVIGEWPAFIDWTENGIAICQDIVTLHPTHPRRRGWQRFCENRQRQWIRTLDTYINSGFVGVSSEHFQFISEWQDKIQLMIEYLPDKNKRVLELPDFHIRRPDQDALNMALACSSYPYSIVGLDGMGFLPGGYMLAHAIETRKPWQTNFFVRSLGGTPPTFAEKCVERFLAGPICPFPSQQIWLRKLSMYAAAAIGRFYRRS